MLGKQRYEEMHTKEASEIDVLAVEGPGTSFYKDWKC